MTRRGASRRPGPRGLGWVGALAVLCAAACAWAARAPFAAGGSEALWIVPALATDSRVELWRLDAEQAEGGVLALSATLHASPLLMAADRAGVVMLFASDAEAHEDTWLLRRVDAPRPGEPPMSLASPRPLPPLAGTPEPAVLLVAEGRPTVLIHEDDVRRSVRTLDGSVWREVALPGLIDHTRPWVLFEVRDRLAILERRPASRARLWTRAPGAAIDAPRAWTPRPLTLPPSPEAVLAIEGEIICLEHDAGDGTVRAHRALADQAAPIASWVAPDEPFAIASMDALVALAWPDAASPTGLALSLHTARGEERFAGPAGAASMFSERDVQGAALLAVSVLLTVLALALRPGDPSATRFPETVVLAPPARRGVAFFLDLLPAGFVLWAALLRDHDVAAWSRVLDEQAPSALLMAALTTLAHSALSEALTGRTLGKLATGCRTITRSGGRPSWGQAFARNTVKAFCPPLAFFIALTPYDAHPGTFDSFVVIDRPPDPPADG